MVAKLLQRVWDGSANQWNTPSSIHSAINGNTRGSGRGRASESESESESGGEENGVTNEPEILRVALGTLARLVDYEGVDDEFRSQVCFYYVPH